MELHVDQANAVTPVLDAYTRVINATDDAWLGALRYFFGYRGNDIRVARPEAPVGYLSSLSVGTGRVGYLKADQALDLRGFNGPRWSIVMVRKGRLSLGLPHRLPRTRNQLQLVAPGQRLEMTSDGPFEAAILQWDAPIRPIPPDPTQHPALHQRMAWHIDGYLQQALFIGNHLHAVRLTERLLIQLRACLQAGYCTCTHNPPSIDNRVARVIRFIREHPDRPFDLAELASLACASERNLYNLMKRHTGLTPYRFYQRTGLLRVREQLLLCRSPAPSISWHALNNGFNHFGRFSALYRQHFGELPSETLAWRQDFHRTLAAGRNTPVACAGDPV